MKERKKPNIVLYTIFMVIIFLLITEGFIWGYGGKLLLNTILNYPKGQLVISEAVLAVLVLIVMLIFKNSYVFSQKKEKLRTGLFYGLFYIIGSIFFMLLFGLVAGGLFSGLTLLNLILGCLLVGICEEFLCRGWLLNEFLERFGDTKKGVWYSIIISGFIFGLIHLGNIFTVGQAIPTTILQVINAAATGIIFGIIYYKTKNIWSVILLHGFWDFSLFLGEVAPVSSTIATESTFSIITIIFTILMVGTELINIIPHIKDIDAKPKKAPVIIFATFGIFFYIIFMLITSYSSSTFGDTYEFGNLSLENYAITKDNYQEYKINYEYNFEKYSFTLSKNNKNNLLLTNNNTDYIIEIECNTLYDYIIMEENNYYVLAYVDYKNSNNVYLNYMYLPKEELSNEDDYLISIKNNIKKYLISTISELVVLSDYENDISYIATYDADYGYYVLVNEDEMSILNRD